MFSSLDNEKTPLAKAKGDKIDAVPPCSRPCTSHTVPFSAFRNHQQLGLSSSPQRPSAFAGPRWKKNFRRLITRFDGRCPGQAKIFTCPAPRPCSAVPTCLFAPTTDLSEGFPDVLSSSQLFSIVLGYYIPDCPDLSTIFSVFSFNPVFLQISVYRDAPMGNALRTAQDKSHP